MPRRLAHRHPDDRFIATLRPRRELLEALWNLAFWSTDKRRRRRGYVKRSVLRVEIWVQASQARVLAAYRRHTAYQLKDRHKGGLDDGVRAMSKRTMTRQFAAFRRHKLIAVEQPARHIKARGGWVRFDNIYTFTYLGKLWIKRHARSVTNPLVV